MNDNMDEKLRDLLCDKAVFGLSDEEATELESFSAGASGDLNEHTFQLAAAAILLAETKLEPMPAHLEAKLLKAADAHFGESAKNSAVYESIHDQPTRNFQWSEPKSKGSIFDWFGWAAAAAACVALVGTIFFYQNRVSELQARVSQLTPTPTVEETLAQKRDRLLAEGGDVKRAEWTKGNVPGVETVTGEVVWSDAKQQGYMTFRGLPVNDANKEAYQLWIFEDPKLEAHPKDGGVFNVTSEGEVIIPITAKLRAVDPKAFAVTVEKPGGVVVSDRSKIALLAPVKPSSA